MVVEAGQCTADSSAMNGVNGDHIQQPDGRWTLESITQGVTRYFADHNIFFDGNPTRTDVVYAAPDGNSAVSMSTFAESGTRVYCGLTPAPEQAAEAPVIVVTGNRNRREDGLSVAERRVRADAFGDRGPNPNRPADAPMIGGQCANLRLEHPDGAGVTWSIPTSDGTGNRMQCDYVPDRFSFENSAGGLQRRELEEAERQAELRRQGVVR